MTTRFELCVPHLSSILSGHISYFVALRVVRGPVLAVRVYVPYGTYLSRKSSTVAMYQMPAREHRQMHNGSDGVTDCHYRALQGRPC